MKILSLDLSTNTGWAFLEDGIPKVYGNIQIRPEDFPFSYPKNYVMTSKELADRITKICRQYDPDVIVIEETNKASRYTSRYSQKLLEWIQFCVADSLLFFKKPMHYFSTSQWRKLVGVDSLRDDQKKINKEIASQRKQAEFELKLKYKVNLAKQYADDVRDKGPKAKALVARKIEKEAKELTQKRMNSEVAVIDGKIMGKITPKHLAVDKVNSVFGLNFKLKDNDVAEAILLGYGYYVTQVQKIGGKTNGSATSKT